MSASTTAAAPRRGGVLRGLDLDVAPGERVGLVGRSGAGKSTLVHLLLGFYRPESGRILIDGRDIAGLTQESLRAQIGMVTQDTSLLHRSIRDNIRYGRPDASEAEIVDAARRAHALEFIEGLEDWHGRTGLDAHVGERGVKLSGGQRQRIALARVILKDAPILVLDEATSALDSEVEAAIQEQLAQLMEGRTVIAIAHRLSTICQMDRLCVLDRGRIVEEGTHERLLASGRHLRRAVAPAIGRVPGRSPRRRAGRRGARPGAGVMVRTADRSSYPHFGSGFCKVIRASGSRSCQDVEKFRTGFGIAQSSGNFALPQSARYRRQGGEMLAVGLFRDEQEEHEIDRTIIDGVKVDRPLQPGKQAKKILQAGDASMRQGYSLADTGRPERFPRPQGLEDLLAIAAHLLRRALGQIAQQLRLVAGWHRGDHALRGYEIRDVHPIRASRDTVETPYQSGERMR